jgi:hypothetical protein
MASVSNITVDITHEIIHDQLWKLAEAFYEQSGVKIEDVRIDWYDGWGIPSYIKEVKIETTKRK